MDDYEYIYCPISKVEVEVNKTQHTANGYGVEDGVVTVEEGVMHFECPCGHDGCDRSYTVEVAA